MGLSVVGETGQDLEIRVCHGPKDLCLCTALQTFIHQTFAFHFHFLLSEVPNHYPQHLLSLAEDAIEGEAIGHFGELLSFPGSVSCIHMIQLEMWNFLPYQ